jgi:hypothetical protein
VINFNPQVLTEAFTVSTEEITIPAMFGQTVQILENNPNRICIIFSAFEGASVINIRPPQTERDGIYLPDLAAPTILDYRNHGAMLGYAWYALNTNPFGDSYISVITSSYRPDR